MSECEEPRCRRVRVLVVDDSAAVRKGIALSVSAFDDLELAGVAANGEEALRLCGCTQADVVLMDVSLPDMSGAAATRTIRERWPLTQVLAMASFQEEDLVPEVLRAQAVGYLLKNVTAAELAAAIRAACLHDQGRREVARRDSTQG